MDVYNLLMIFGRGCGIMRIEAERRGRNELERRGEVDDCYVGGMKLLMG